MEEALHQIKGICVVGNDGKRIFGKYFGLLKGDLSTQNKLEKSFFAKSTKSSSGIV